MNQSHMNLMIENELLREIKQRSWALKLEYDDKHLPWYSIHQIMAQFEEPFDEVKVATLCAQKATPGSKYWGMSVEEIIASWKEKCEKAAYKGVGLDTYIQTVLHGVEAPEIDDISLLRKCGQFDDFKKNILDKNNLQFIGSEIWINSAVYGVRGRLDALFLMGNELVIFDWKNNDVFKTSQYEMSKGPLFEYPKSDIIKFTIQVYAYKYILEEEMDFKVSGCRIVQFREDMWMIHKPIFGYSVGLMQHIFEYAISEIKAKQYGN